MITSVRDGCSFSAYSVLLLWQSVWVMPLSKYLLSYKIGYLLVLFIYFYYCLVLTYQFANLLCRQLACYTGPTGKFLLNFKIKKKKVVCHVQHFWIIYLIWFIKPNRWIGRVTLNNVAFNKYHDSINILIISDVWISKYWVHMDICSFKILTKLIGKLSAKFQHQVYQCEGGWNWIWLRSFKIIETLGIAVLWENMIA